MHPLTDARAPGWTWRRLPAFISACLGYKPSMRIAVLGDLHLISDADPCIELRRLRTFFSDGLPAMRRLMTWLNTLHLDAVFSVGDVIDWHSEANIILALEVLSQLHCPWHMTPGNHDLQFPTPGAPPGSYQLDPPDTFRPQAIARWRRHGVDLGRRRIGCADGDVLLVDSASSRIGRDSMDWIRKQPRRSILLTHVPLDTPAIRAHIHEREPHRNLEIYTQSGSPEVFASCIRGHIAHVVTGHLHGSGTLVQEGTTFHMIDGSFARGLQPPTVALIEASADQVAVTAIAAPL